MDSQQYTKICWRCEQPYTSRTAFPLEVCQECWDSTSEDRSWIAITAATLFWLVPVGIFGATNHIAMLLLWLIGWPVLAVGIATLQYWHEQGWFKWIPLVFGRRKGR